MSPKSYLEVDPMASDPLTIPHLSEALKTLEEIDQEVQEVTAEAQKLSCDRTLPLTGKKNQKVTTKKKARGSVVKLAATSLSAIDEVASVSSSFQSLEEEVDKEDDVTEETEVDAPNQEGSYFLDLDVQVDNELVW
eukprot:4334785-Amphidinium_carterae.1